ncbi:hypothetical protein QQS21_002930 [Conoideocrella luteorostrata]|uniref:GPR1/FUN34/YaaH-class plasma membrane protein n=1 Tax=Conoideocrella luteorostrata TaxID=1105319 RepID=A0AAJ0FWW2_9HYPO|nr:hypothetical protein QQS21_002930 [Conoideocrella luteorostrata]
MTDNSLYRKDTGTSIALSPEQFERLYLSPPNAVRGNLRKTFSNPTPLGIAGLLLAITPLTCELQEWGGSYGNGVATLATYYFLGGMCSELAAIGNFILGNTLPTTFFGIYGGFFLAFGFTMTPSSGAANKDVFPKGPEDPGVMASLGFFAIFMGVFTFVIMIGSLRTNLPLLLTFSMLGPTFVIFGCSRLYGAQGDEKMLKTLQHAAGALGFASICTGWYLFLAEILAGTDFPIQVPIFDLSQRVPSATELSKRKRIVVDA